MRLLILGGTGFVGRAVAAHAVAAGHRVTCAARGVTGAVPAGAEHVPVDRDDPDGLAALGGRTFDAVLDVASRPSRVRRAVAALAGGVGHWTYVSTGSVYADTATPGQRVDTAPVLPAAPPEVDDPAADGMRQYGPCKVACEDAVLSAGVPAFVCRAGLIVGPEDRSDRFTYWPARLARGGEVLAPGGPDEPVQFIDVRDLAQWLIRAGETGLTGVYDGIGPSMSRLAFLTQVSAGAGRPDPHLVWVGQQFLVDQGIDFHMGPRSLPLWLPLPEYAGHSTRDVAPSLAAGLGVRDLEGTARDTLAWYAAAGEPALACGLAPEDESAVLVTWREYG
jgi:nucleoside-diphosphate-sugar epimerase